jgi:hypothetical protein
MTDPSGAIRYRGPKDKETVHIITIDPNDALDKNLNPQNDLFKDRRPDMYQLVEFREH